MYKCSRRGCLIAKSYNAESSISVLFSTFSFLRSGALIPSLRERPVMEVWLKSILFNFLRRYTPELKLVWESIFSAVIFLTILVSLISCSGLEPSKILLLLASCSLRWAREVGAEQFDSLIPRTPASVIPGLLCKHNDVSW